MLTTLIQKESMPHMLSVRFGVFLQKNSMKPISYALSVLLVLGTLSAAFAKAPGTAKIAFTSNRDGNSEIYIMNPDGSEQANLTQHNAVDYSPVWSPTGEQILFVSDQHGTRDLYLMNSDGTNVRKVFNKLVGRQHPTWSPDGKQFAYHRFNKLVIYIASSDGKNDKKLTNGLWRVWSPDGTEIAFVADEKFAIIADRVLQVENSKIQIINLQTNVEETLLPEEKLMLGPAWAPNGTKIAFSWINPDALPIAGKDIGDTEAIYIVNRDGSRLKQIVDAYDTAASNPIWAPQGNELVYEKKVLEDNTSSK